jgi:hypothetical protein
MSKVPVKIAMPGNYLPDMRIVRSTGQEQPTGTGQQNGMLPNARVSTPHILDHLENRYLWRLGSEC